MRLYKMQIIQYPEASLMRVTHLEDGEPVFAPDRRWKPDGWKEWVDEAADDWGRQWAKTCREEGYPFFWPSEKRTYLTKESAESKAWAVRRWGGQAIVLEAEVGEFVEVEEARRRRAMARDLARAEKLEAKAKALLDQAAALVSGTDSEAWS